jgi:hypothetical protein
MVGRMHNRGRDILCISGRDVHPGRRWARQKIKYWAPVEIIAATMRAKRTLRFNVGNSNLNDIGSAKMTVDISRNTYLIECLQQFTEVPKPLMVIRYLPVSNARLQYLSDTQGIARLGKDS